MKSYFFFLSLEEIIEDPKMWEQFISTYGKNYRLPDNEEIEWIDLGGEG